MNLKFVFINPDSFPKKIKLFANIIFHHLIINRFLRKIEKDIPRITKERWESFQKRYQSMTNGNRRVMLANLFCGFGRNLPLKRRYDLKTVHLLTSQELKGKYVVRLI